MVAFKVNKSDTIGRLKATMCEKEGIAGNTLELYYNDECLQDCRIFADCGIQENCTLLALHTSGIVKLTLKIASGRQKTIVVTANRSNSIFEVKLKIQEKEGIHSDSCTLLYMGKVLESGTMLSSLGIKDEATFNLVINHRDNVTLSIKLPTGEIVKTDAKIWFTVCDVKEIIGSMFGFSGSDHSIVYQGKQLADSFTLASYNINEESILDMLPKLFQIFVKLDSGGNTITLDVSGHDKISSVKSKIFKKQPSRPTTSYYLVYAGKYLVDDQDLASLGVGEISTLYQYHKFSSLLD